MLFVQDVIKVKNASYERYEELLLKKEELLKEAEQYKIQYNEIFNVLNNDTYDAKMECIKKRKTVTYCENLMKLGSLIHKKELDAYIEKAMEDYKRTLDFILNDKTDNSIHKSEDYIKEAKSVYRRIARLVHPDMHADLKDNKTVMDLWNRACIAYNCLNLNDLQELEVLINRYLESINKNHDEIEIPNVEQKIFDLNAEIDKIKHSDPYQYKYVIADKAAIIKKKEELLKELNDYRRYIDELNKQIEGFNIIEE